LQVWTAPLEAAAIIALLLWRTGGVYGLPALGVVLVVLPLQYYFGYQIAQHKAENVEVSDARVLRMHEVLLAIKLVKFYVWEKSFARQVKEVSISCSSAAEEREYGRWLGRGHCPASCASPGKAGVQGCPARQSSCKHFYVSYV
jgi:hypothetical protein